MRFEVLLEGFSDMPTVREILTRRFGLVEHADFRLHPHRGKGRLPRDLLSRPDPRLQGLLDQLPAKLRGFSHLGEDACVVVLVDADDESCVELRHQLSAMLERLPKRPKNVLFRIAIEEVESWLIADSQAVFEAFPRAKVARLKKLAPDALVGAWEHLADALGIERCDVTGLMKRSWAEKIAPHLEMHVPPSPSMRKFIEGVQRHLSATAAASK